MTDECFTNGLTTRDDGFLRGGGLDAAGHVSLGGMDGGGWAESSESIVVVIWNYYSRP